MEITERTHVVDILRKYSNNVQIRKLFSFMAFRYIGIVAFAISFKVTVRDAAALKKIPIADMIQMIKDAIKPKATQQLSSLQS